MGTVTGFPAVIQADCRDCDTHARVHTHTHTITDKVTINDGNNVNTEPMPVRENESKTIRDGETKERRGERI